MPLVFAGAYGWLMADLAEYIAAEGLTDLVILAGYVPDEELTCFIETAVRRSTLRYSKDLDCLFWRGCNSVLRRSRRARPPFWRSLVQQRFSSRRRMSGLCRPPRVASDEALRGHLSRQGRARAAAFSPAHTARRFIDLYAKAIAAPKRCPDASYLSLGGRVEIPYIGNELSGIVSSGDMNGRQTERAILSVVLPTRISWLDIQDTIGPFIHYALTSGIELIVANGEREPTWPAEVRARVRLLWIPGADIFTLRAEGLAAATSEIVALTEDHCVPAPDWCSRIVAAFRAHPDCTVIGGAIANGSDNTITGRANYIIIFA